LSYFLAKITQLSKSYLNGGKGKISKTDKVILLSEKLDVSYDHMVSLSWIIICSNWRNFEIGILKEIPLIFFGIQENDLIDIITTSTIKSECFYKYYY
jgi:hypothetical protein